jgi:hypothetical protein
LHLYLSSMKFFISFLGFWLITSINVYCFGINTFISDTGKTIIYLSDSKVKEESILRNCHKEIVHSLCELQEIYPDKNVYFCLHSEKSLTESLPLQSVFDIHVGNSGCEVSFSVEKIYNYIGKTMLPKLQNITVTENNVQLIVVKPRENAVIYYKDILFSWEKYSYHDHYLIEMASDRDFLNILYSNIVSDVKINCPELPKNTLLFWRIKPLQCGGYCQEYRASGKFYSTDVFFKSFSLYGVSLYSLSPPHQKNIFINNPEKKWYSIQIENLKGDIHTSFETNASEKVVDLENFPSGAYFVYLSVNNNQSVSTLIIP